MALSVNVQINAAEMPVRIILRIGVMLVLVAGCGPKAATHLISGPLSPRPFVKVDPFARDVLAHIAADQKLGPEWWVRLEVAWKPDIQIEVNIEKKRPGPNDFVVDADDLHIVMADEQKVYLRSALISMHEVKDGIVFEVTFPNRDAADRQRATHWLKRRGEAKGHEDHEMRFTSRLSHVLRILPLR